jgi:hypothetical protein
LAGLLIIFPEGNEQGFALIAFGEREFEEQAPYPDIFETEPQLVQLLFFFPPGNQVSESGWFGFVQCRHGKTD